MAISAMKCNSFCSSMLDAVPTTNILSHFSPIQIVLVANTIHNNIFVIININTFLYFQKISYIFSKDGKTTSAFYHKKTKEYFI